MKVVCLWTTVLLVILLTGCQNRFETYEPYSAYDERMAAAQREQQYYRGDYPSQGYARDDYGDNNYYYQDQPAPAKRSSAAAPAATSAPNSNSEVPFDSSRSEKHAMNIGAMEDPSSRVLLNEGSPA